MGDKEPTITELLQDIESDLLFIYEHESSTVYYTIRRIHEVLTKLAERVGEKR